MAVNILSGFCRSRSIIHHRYPGPLQLKYSHYHPYRQTCQNGPSGTTTDKLHEHLFIIHTLFAKFSLFVSPTRFVKSRVLPVQRNGTSLTGNTVCRFCWKSCSNIPAGKKRSSDSADRARDPLEQKEKQRNTDRFRTSLQRLRKENVMNAIRKKRKAFVDKKNCVACGCCMKVCPMHAIEIYKGIVARVNFEKCVGCGKCARECPASVIEIQEVQS